MHRDYHRWYSHRLNRDMGVDVYGHYGMPILAFPTSMGDEWEQEGQGMIRTLSPYIEQGRIRIFSINSVHSDSFSKQGSAPVPSQLDAGAIRRLRGERGFPVHRLPVPDARHPDRHTRAHRSVPITRPTPSSSIPTT